MAFDDPTMDDDLREILAAHEIVLGEEWADGRPRLGVVCATEADDGLNNGRRPATRQQMSRKNGALGGNFTTPGLV